MNENQNQDSKNQSTQQAPMAIRREIQSSGSGLMSNDVDLQVRTAKTFPRDISKFKQQTFEMATIDKETAESCSYAYKRGGKIIEGPSVRFSEIIASSYGNLRVAARTTGADDGFIYAESVCWDLESNFAVSYETRRRITNKEGKRFNDDMIGITGNAAVSIAFRNSVFRVVPRAYVNEIWKAARKVAASGQTLEQKRIEMLHWFESQGVTEQQILDLLNISALDGISKEQLAMLRGFAQSIKDGLTSIESIFHGDEQQDETDKSQDSVVDSSQDTNDTDNEQPEAVPADVGQVGGSQTTEQPSADSLDAQKAKLIDLICTELGRLHPGNSIESQASRLKMLSHIFGITVLDEIVKLPAQILEAGLGAMKSQAAANESANEDIPV